jgi:hypothetical protein
MDQPERDPSRRAVLITGDVAESLISVESKPNSPSHVLLFLFQLLGPTGFDVGYETPGACRGADSSLNHLQILAANDNSYALAA